MLAQPDLDRLMAYQHLADRHKLVDRVLAALAAGVAHDPRHEHPVRPIIRDLAMEAGFPAV
jgi:hypothetical protein